MRNLSLIKSDQRSIRFALEPVYALQSSLCLINDEVDGLHPWVDQMRRDLSVEEKSANSLFCHTTTYLGGKSWEGPRQWLEYLQTLTDEQMIDIEIAQLRTKALEHLGMTEEEFPSREDLLKDSQAYVGIMKRYWEFEDLQFDEAMLVKQHRLLANPGEKRRFIVDHFTRMYENYLRSEWESHEQDMKDSIRAFTSLDYESRDRREAVLDIIQRSELSESVMAMFLNAREIIFIPSPHIGPYIMIMGEEDGVLRVVHGARIPEGASLKSPSLVRAELLLRLEALADEHRLKILQLIAERGEIGSQDLIDAMDLSQSSISRHLKQLTANGFLRVRSMDRMKYFSLNVTRFDLMFQTLKRYIGG